MTVQSVAFGRHTVLKMPPNLHDFIEQQLWHLSEHNI